MQPLFLAALIVVAVLSIAVAPRVRTADGFFRGTGDSGAAPGLWTLVLSQVTTWIFARSLLNAAILGYLFGIVGTLAYAAYYLSFLTGGRIVDAIRFRHGHASIQEYMQAAFGRFGVATYNIVIALRLVSEVFANLLVVGLIFGGEGTAAYMAVILAASAVTTAYAMMGGLSASLRTDVLQMGMLLALLAALLGLLLTRDDLHVGALLSSSTEPWSPGWALLAVALLQVWSYPLHDPVMMDRGYLAGRDLTRRSFRIAFWLSFSCVVAFGLIGVHAGLHRLEGEALMDTLPRLMPAAAILMVNLALVVSAVSTLDSTLASASKLAIVDMTADEGRTGDEFEAPPSAGRDHDRADETAAKNIQLHREACSRRSRFLRWWPVSRLSLGSRGFPDPLSRPPSNPFSIGMSPTSSSAPRLQVDHATHAEVARNCCQIVGPGCRFRVGQRLGLPKPLARNRRRLGRRFHFPRPPFSRDYGLSLNPFREAVNSLFARKYCAG